jgi:hypothetical protein
LRKALLFAVAKTIAFRHCSSKSTQRKNIIKEIKAKESSEPYKSIAYKKIDILKEIFLRSNYHGRRSSISASFKYFGGKIKKFLYESS